MSVWLAVLVSEKLAQAVWVRVKVKLVLPPPAPPLLGERTAHKLLEEVPQHATLPLYRMAWQ